jgi:hypothetical protein
MKFRLNAHRPPIAFIHEILLLTIYTLYINKEPFINCLKLIY